jgi:ESCRT-II complex subunit
MCRRAYYCVAVIVRVVVGRADEGESEIAFQTLTSACAQDFLVSDGSAEWIGGGATRARIWWRSAAEWGSLIYKWVRP